MKNIYKAVFLFAILLTSSVTSLASVKAASVRQPCTNVLSTCERSEDPETLSIAMVETVTILENGSSELTLLINVPSSPLAEMYRRSLGAPVDVHVEEEVPIPENMTLSAETELGEKATQIVIPVREEFHRSIEQLQKVSLGLNSEIFHSRMVPRSSSNGCRVSINAYTSLPIVNIIEIGSHDKWKIALGARDENAIGAAVGFAFTDVEFIQLMLESLPEEQLYKCFWSTRVRLPPNADLFNGEEIAGLNWKVDFGGGTYRKAVVSLDGDSTIILDETTMVTEQKVAATPRYLYGAFSSYKVFSIEYLLPHSSSPHQNEETGNVSQTGDTWSYPWSVSWSDSISVPFDDGPLSAQLTVSADITLSGYVGWEFGLFEGLTEFESWMSLETSVEVDFQAEATASFAETWEEKLFEWKTTYSFMVGVVPVWADFVITATGVLTVNAYGELFVTAGASASASFKAGVRWTSAQGWTQIWEISKSASYTDPTIEAEAGVWIRPSVEFRLAFLFYGVAGPFIEFEPYATATVTCSYPPPHGTWKITANLKVIAGATFAGWLKTLLGLDDWCTTLYHQELAQWSGSWGPSSISISETLNPSTSPPSSPVQVYGTATLSDGRPVSYADVIITITQTGASWTTTTDASGSYSTYISAPETAGTYSIQVSVSTGSLTGSNTRTLTVQGIPDGGTHYQLYRTTTCKDVMSDYPWDPIEETDVFRSDDFIAYTWVHLTDIDIELWVRWEWYDPDDKYYWGIEKKLTGYGGPPWEWFKKASGIYIAGYKPEDMEGRWRCEVSIDEGSGYELVAIEEFVIRYEIISAYRTMAKDVQGGVDNPTYPYDPINPTNKFLNTDPRALGWIRLDELAERIEVKWEWRDPSGNIDYTGSYTSKDPADEGYLYYTWYKFWGWINIYGTSRQSNLGRWELRTYIKDVYGNWDLEYSEYFMISDNTPPGTPGIPVDDGDYSTTGTVTWTWTAAYEDGTVAKYQVQVGTTPGGNDIFDGYVGDVSKTLNALPSGSTYYARVRAMNTVGQWGDWSGWSDGITVDRPPVTIIVEGPSGPIEYDDVLFTWKGSDDVTPTANLEYAYYLQGKDAGWSPWGSNTSKQYSNLEDNDYLFLVKARDQILNVDPTPANRSFTVSVVCAVHLKSEEDTIETSNLGTIEFNGIEHPLPANISCVRAQYTAKYNPDVGYLFDHWETTSGISVSAATDNPTTVTVGDNGSLRAVYARAPDIAVTDIVTSKTVIGQGYCLSLNITVENQGSHAETFNLTACANTTVIERKEITLANGSSTTITFTWNTTYFAKGNYTVKAEATPVPGEIDTADNTYIDDWVVVTIAGDIDGDCDVDYKDLFILARAYGCSRGDECYVPNADLDCNGIIDYKDLFILARHYGQEDP